MSSSNQNNTLDKVLGAGCIKLPMSSVVFQHFLLSYDGGGRESDDRNYHK